MHTLFSSAPLPARGWYLPLVTSLDIFLVVELGKALLRRRSSAATSARDR